MKILEIEFKIETEELFGETWYKCTLPVLGYPEIVAFGRSEYRALGLALQQASDQLLKRD